VGPTIEIRRNGHSGVGSSPFPFLFSGGGDIFISWPGERAMRNGCFHGFTQSVFQASAYIVPRLLFSRSFPGYVIRPAKDTDGVVE